MSKIKFAIKSKLNGKYLSHLFEDDHYKMFTQNTFQAGKCYYYSNEKIAKSVAQELNGEVVSIIA